MKRWVVVFFLMAGSVYGQTPSPRINTLEMPANTMLEILNYLGARPYAEVHAMIETLQACASVQAPGPDGVIVDRGQCPMVSQAIHERAAKAMPAPAPKTP